MKLTLTTGPARAGITLRSFMTLVLVASMLAGSVVAARIAMDDGLAVTTAVAVRSLATATVVGVLWRLGRVPAATEPRHRRVLVVIGLLLAIQSVCLYSAVASIPVGLALLAFNSYPLWIALAAWVGYGERPERRVLLAMPVILTGLAVALDVAGASAGIDARAQWEQIGTGVVYAVAAAACYALAMVLTQHEVAGLDGRFRTMSTLCIVGMLALATGFLRDDLQQLATALGWAGLLCLSALYGTAITVVFTVLPRLGVAASSPILNIEPIAALALAWLLLGQDVAPLQLVGVTLVVGAVVWLGLRHLPSATSPGMVFKRAGEDP